MLDIRHKTYIVDPRGHECYTLINKDRKCGRVAVA